MEQMELSQQMPRQEEQRPKQATALLYQLMEDVRALNAAVSIISEKMKHLTRNEKILGRNLIVLNKKIQSLKESSTGEIPPDLLEQLEALQRKAQELEDKTASMMSLLSDMQQQSVSAAEIKELKYVIESINPLELATLEQVKELIDQRLAKKGL